MRNHSFPGDEQPKPPKVLPLVDGGIYDNMGSEWLLNTEHTPDNVYKIVVNASRNLGMRRAPYRSPIIGDVITLLRERDIAQTIARLHYSAEQAWPLYLATSFVPALRFLFSMVIEHLFSWC